jgi:integrase
MVFSFARVGAMVTMLVEDYFVQNRRSWLRLHEKGGKHHEMPCHHKLEEYIDAYVKAAGIEDNKTGPLFRTAPRRSDALTTNAMTTDNVWRMIQKRARAAGIKTEVCCHSFRATGITVYLEGGGTLDEGAAAGGT